MTACRGGACSCAGGECVAGAACGGRAPCRADESHCASPGSSAAPAPPRASDGRRKSPDWPARHVVRRRARAAATRRRRGAPSARRCDPQRVRTARRCAPRHSQAARQLMPPRERVGTAASAWARQLEPRDAGELAQLQLQRRRVLQSNARAGGARAPPLQVDERVCEGPAAREGGQQPLAESSRANTARPESACAESKPPSTRDGASDRRSSCEGKSRV